MHLTMTMPLCLRVLPAHLQVLGEFSPSGAGLSWAEERMGPRAALCTAPLASFRGARGLSSPSLPEFGPVSCLRPVYTHSLLRDGEVTRFARPIIVEKTKQAHFIPVTLNLPP